ncbi:hypothetical protein [Escherichia coli]|uniref:hypothetical protein n=1 Tax=Escherichia coli TaxID=562 RepID=UPI0006A5F707|nr:hypothetical protein [Escherichia coli]EEW5070484.1 hypothetical protein [Escherichia coli]EEY2487138.1 hypothetical protein [Escherichia coli]EFA4887438.1 hypothetical protein [Escherichia coli]EFF3871921.1 hypothetical protein [Escherichia coli]EFF3886776.1 hypothetical protein [Escherichia coli]
MISVKTYLKINNEFIEFHEYNGGLSNINYIEGALELSINGVVLIDKTMWDYIDQLWAYIVNGVENILNDEPFETYFPDQPIKLKVIPSNENIIFSVECDTEKKVFVNRKYFIETMASSAIEFFDFLRKNHQSFDSDYKNILVRLQR